MGRFGTRMPDPGAWQAGSGGSRDHTDLMYRWNDTLFFICSFSPPLAGSNMLSFAVWGLYFISSL